MNELILVVDDEPKIVKLARDYLERGGFRLLTATDGTTALAVARHEQPDLIILDLNLPGTDGLDVCRLMAQPSSFSCRYTIESKPLSKMPPILRQNYGLNLPKSSRVAWVGPQLTIMS